MISRYFLSFFIICSSISLNSCLNLKKENIVVLYTKSDVIVPDLPDNCCLYIPLENFKNTQLRAKTIILAGHGKPPLYANHSIEYVSKAIASFKPELIVMNSCYGSSDILLKGLIKVGLKSMVVAPPFPIYLPGFNYENDFLNPELSVEERAKAVKVEPYYPILKWHLNEKELNESIKKVRNMSKSELKKNLRTINPPLVKVKLSSKLEPNSDLLVMVPPEKLK
ncbi:MAG: hypothetical protein U0354_09990 [Candidatus Sericytochromatia bacterium]